MLLQMANQYMPIIIWSVGALMFWRGTVTIGQLVAFVGLLAFVQAGNQRSCSMLTNSGSPPSPAWKPFWKFLDSSELDEITQPRRLVPLRGEIRFRDVTFTYPGTDSPALHEISQSPSPLVSASAWSGRPVRVNQLFLDLILGFYRARRRDASPGTKRGRGGGGARKLDQIGCLHLRRSGCHHEPGCVYLE